jgi:hypothetical protein
MYPLCSILRDEQETPARPGVRRALFRPCAGPPAARRLDAGAANCLHRGAVRNRNRRRCLQAGRHVGRKRLSPGPPPGRAILPHRLADGDGQCRSPGRRRRDRPRHPRRARAPLFPGRAGRRASPLRRAAYHVHPAQSRAGHLRRRTSRRRPHSIRRRLRSHFPTRCVGCCATRSASWAASHA